MNCESWTRFEVSYRGSYAHQIGDNLTEICSEAELSRFIAARIADKYRFLVVSSDDDTSYTHALLQIAKKDTASALRSENPQNNSLRQSIAYLIKGSGLFPTLYKVGSIWGKEAEIELLQRLYALYRSEFVPDAKRDYKLQHWLKQNQESLSKQNLVECFYCGGQKYDR